jgi:hypothetical protein
MGERYGEITQSTTLSNALTLKEHPKRISQPDVKVDGSGGSEIGELLSQLRCLYSPNLRQKALQEFFDTITADTLKQLSDEIHRVYMLLDPFSTVRLIQFLELAKTSTPNNVEIPELETSLSSALETFYSKSDYLPFRQGQLAQIKSLPETEWESAPKSHAESGYTRRIRLQKLRGEWRQSKMLPLKP